MRTGTDIIDIARVKNAIERTGGYFAERVYTPVELEYCGWGERPRYDSFAARFAAKEAYSKAIGTGIGPNARLAEIEVFNEESGRPRLRLYGETLRYFEEHFPGQEIDLSLAHTKEIAVASVIIG